MVITKTNTHAGPPLGSRWAQKWAYMWAEQLVRFWYMLPKVIITRNLSISTSMSEDFNFPLTLRYKRIYKLTYNCIKLAMGGAVN